MDWTWTRSRRTLGVFALATGAGIAAVLLDASVATRAALVAGVCLLLWLTAWVPVWVPTIVLWVATPLLLATRDGRFAPLEVVRWSVDPVLALFLGGFALAAAAKHHGVDVVVADFSLKRAGNSAARLVAIAALATAFLSMWMSNVAAAALMLHAFRPIWGKEAQGSALRGSLLLGIALAANVGGIATPIGTGANGIAMAAVAHTRPIGFLNWMVFGVPLAVGLAAIVVMLVLLRFRPPKLLVQSNEIARSADTPGASPALYRRFAIIFSLTVLLWLTEPLHGIAAWMISLGAVVSLLVSQVISWRELVQIDWGTLMLVAGGIALGVLLDQSGIVADIATALPLTNVPVTMRLLGLCLLGATLSALMSNTGTAAFLIPLAATLDPAPSTAIIVAVACSLGMPFAVSTPANAMAVAGGLRTTDLLVPGLILMVGGCVLVALTGPFVLGMVGIS